MQKTIKVGTANTTAIITSAEAKAHCKIDITTDDAVIANLILSVRAACEKAINGHLLSTTVILQQDDFEYANNYPTNNAAIPFLYNLSYDYALGLRYVQLLRLPVIAITTVKFTDQDNAETTVDSGDYYLDNGGRLVFSSDIDIVNLRELAGIKVTYTVGYGTVAGDCPIELKLAMLDHIFYKYNAISVRSDKRANLDPFKLPDGIKAVYDNYRNINGI